MTNKVEAPRFRRGIALLLCFVLSAFNGRGFAEVKNTAATERVGRVTGVVSAATRNGKRVSLNDVVQANDDFTTDDSGRMSIELQDGSILSAGTSTQVTIVKHDPLTGETLVNLNSGRLRSRVVKLRNSGKFEITSPHATIIAMGTDFFVEVSSSGTQVVVYAGVVVVTSGSRLADNAAKLMLDVDAGQNVLIDAEGISHLQLTEGGMEQHSMAETIVPEASAPAMVENNEIPQKSSHATRNILIGGLAAGALIGAVLGLRGSKSPTTTSTPSTQPTIPPH